MLLADWPNAVAHVDADCFFAACEIARRPELRAQPVCVMSSQDACIVAKTYDAKAVGIATGMPVWEAKKLLPRAVYIPADFAYYGQMSDKLFAILSRFSPEVEIYSIDEGFVGMNGIRGLWRKSFGGIADAIRAAVKREVGITVSIGVSVTKTLAKIASDVHKPDGTTLVPGREIPAFLAGIKIKDIPGIGRNRAALLNKFEIFTAADYTEADSALLQRLLGKTGVDLWHELRGTPLFPVELTPKLPKSVARTASLGQVTQDREIIAAHLSYHTTRLAAELAGKRHLTRRLTVFLTLKSFAAQVAETRFNDPTANVFTFSKAVRETFAQLYTPGELYRGCGVIATEISPSAERSLDLFGNVLQDEHKEKLLNTVDSLNKKYGNHTVSMLAAIPAIKKKKRSRFRLPMFEAE
jgi:DNA polymerase-4/DNA polymerase V